MRKLYSFINECGMCAAGLAGGSSYESLASGGGNWFDVYGNKGYNNKKSQKKKKKKYERHIKGMNVL